MNSFRKPVIISQITGGGFVNGRYVEGSTANISILASVQPADSRDISRTIEMLPEGRRVTELYRLYTNVRLNTLTNGENPDIATVDGGQFEVIAEANWSNNVINHYKYIINKIKES